jgi:tRNA nucleotidyltransferase/poly(A) polymerase
MKNFLDNIFSRSNNLDHISREIKNLTSNTPSHRIFEAINSYSAESEIRYVGGCVRKIINNERVDDIDLATNLEPKQVCDALSRKDIKYYETGVKHGTITAIIDEHLFEITSLRKDIQTDGRHAKVEFSKNWKEDASRRDFTINSIYSDKDGNLFDPYNGKKDLEDGCINFIGNTDIRIKEDYLRILRYLRFFINYSKQPHNPETIRKLKINIGGISKLSKERLLDELRKIVSLTTLEKISKDRLILDLISVIFPELKNIKIFSKLNENQKVFLVDTDFIFLISLMIVDGTDNVDYFLYKFNISKKNQKRIKIIDEFFKENKNKNTFSEKNMNKVFYYNGRQAVIDILRFRIITTKKFDKKLIELIKFYKDKISPIMPVGANVLMAKYKIPEGKQLGLKLKIIEEEWVKNDFKISDEQIEQIVNN